MADDLDLDDLLNETLNEMEELEKQKDEDKQIESTPAPVSPKEATEKVSMDGLVGDADMREFMEGITALMKEVSEDGAGLSSSGESSALEALHEAMKSNLEETAGSEPFPEDFSKAFGQFMENMGGEDGDFFQTAMKSLLSKDVLHEPMVALRDKYPSWLEANKDTISGEDYSRFTKQYEHICRICDIYDNNPDNFDELMGVMQKMEESGQPPQSLLTDLGYDESVPFGGMGGMSGMDGIPEGGFPGMEELMSGMSGEMPDVAGMEEFARQLMAGLNFNGDVKGL